MNRNNAKKRIEHLRTVYADDELDFVIELLKEGFTPDVLHSLGLNDEADYVMEFSKEHGLL